MEPGRHPGETPTSPGSGPGHHSLLSSSRAIELRHLRYFLAVYEELHFGRAAKRLSMAQPPLSQAIRKLEVELGVQLFERTSRRVTATEAGHVFAEEARKVLVSFGFAVVEARRAGGTEPALQIGCIPHLSIAQLLRFLGELHQRDPMSPAEVTHLSSPEQVSRLQVGELDFGIVDHAEEYPEIELEALFPGEELSAFLPREHPLAAKHALGPDDLREEHLVTFHRSADPGLHERLLALIQDAGYRFLSVREAGSLNGRDLPLAVAAGLGIAFGPKSLAEVRGARGIVVRRPLEPAPALPDTLVAWHANPPLRLQEKRSLIQDLARELRAQG